MPAAPRPAETHQSPDTVARQAVLSPLLVATEFGAMTGWPADDHAAALACFRLSARRMVERPYTTKALGIDGVALREIGEQSLAADRDKLGDGKVARAFFERHFTPWRVRPPDGATGFVTGYFEPELPASPVRTKRFVYPVYRRPPDLVDIDDTNRPAGMGAEFRFARRLPDGRLKEYFDRELIEAGALAGKGLELAWLESAVDGFFVHVQGSARLLMTDGTVKRLTYAGKSGHPYTPIGRLLVETGELARDAVTMTTIRHWLEAHRDRASALMAKNRSFIFFAVDDEANPSLGPVGAASVPLTAGRSVALDHRLHTFGTPVWIATHAALPGDTKPFRRLMIGQDTGSAIVGPARGDLFIGSGRQAGEFAGAIRHAADFTVLVPRPIGGAGR